MKLFKVLLTLAITLYNTTPNPDPEVTQVLTHLEAQAPILMAIGKRLWKRLQAWRTNR